MMSSALSSIVEERSPLQTALEGFVYGEHREGPQQRSLGFGLLSPTTPAPWSEEVENLARRLHAAPYPDDWPVVDLFCSVLLQDGRRLVAVARYGVSDSTPSRRRGGLELIGVVGPHSLSLTSVLAIDRWLRQQRSKLEQPESFSGPFDLVEVLAEAPLPAELSPTALPQPIDSERAIVLAASEAGEPDSRLGILMSLHDLCWQWLPFVAEDFALNTYAQRGPLVAWATPPSRASWAVARSAVDGVPQAQSSPLARRSGLGWIALLSLLLFGLLGVNAWYLWRLDQRLDELKLQTSPVVERQAPGAASPPPAPSTVEGGLPADHEALAKALYDHLRLRGNIPENQRTQLLQNYDRLAARDPALRVSSVEGRLALGAVGELSKRKTPAQIEAIIRGIAAEKKGLDERVVDLIAERVYQRLTENGDK